MTDKHHLDIVGVGPQKTASTWLFSMLKRHPDICFPDGVKETFFWDENFSRGLNWYFSHFSACDKTRNSYAEIGPTYFTSRDAASRIFENNDQCKIIITLRSPVDRAFSLYLHHSTKGRVRCPFWEAVDAYPEIIEGSRYSTWLPMWLNKFGDANVLIILQDDVQHSPQDQLKKVLDFLSLRDFESTLPANERINAASWPRSYWIAKFSTGLASVLRKLGLYFVVNVGKKIGLKNIVYKGGEINIPSLDPKLAHELHQSLLPEIDYVEQKLDRNLADWRRYA